LFCFFFQAEDGIRDRNVTGVQTCALPICWHDSREIPGVTYSAQEVAGQTFVNDLERPVFEKFVFLGQLKMWLLKQPEVGAALMSGSGSTIFTVLRDSGRANQLAARAKAKIDSELWTCACETC